MVRNKSVLVVLVFAICLSFGLLCSASDYSSKRKYQECQRRCRSETRGEREQDRCEETCASRYREEKQEEEEEDRRRDLNSRRGDEHEEGRQSRNPFYFPRKESFEARFEEEHGSFRVLQKFSEKSHVLKDIDEFRLAILEANPNAFVLPHHCDAEKIYVVTNGKGTLTFVTQENKESFNLVPGVVVRVPAGSTVYLVNQDNKEKLTIAVLHRPVNNPGHFEAFFPVGPQNPDQSYYRTFSQEIIETVLNTRREQLDRLFEGKQSQQGLFREASQEQVRSLSQEATSPKQKGGEKFAFNLLNQSPKYSNQNGRLYEACPREFELLRDVDVAVSAIQIKQGSIFVPHYNSEATFAVLITEGNGYVEMVCPHLSRSHHESEEEGGYRKITARLSPGDIFVVPAGHPVTWVASKDNELRTLAFGLNFQNSKRIFIAGKNNNVRKWDSEAKELSWGVPAKVVDEVFNSPQESYFVSGSQDRDNNPLSSILD